MKTRLMLVDPYELFRTGLRAMFTTIPDMEVVAEAEKEGEVLWRFAGAKPDIVLMEIDTPGHESLDAIKTIRKIDPNVKIIFVTTSTDMNLMVRGIKVGGNGYVHKTAEFPELIEAIRVVIKGQYWLNPGITTSIIQSMLSGATTEKPEKLTYRERRVIKMLAEGRSSRKIADELGISAKTAESHRYRAMKKLGVNSIVDVVIYAMREGIIHQHCA